MIKWQTTQGVKKFTLTMVFSVLCQVFPFKFFDQTRQVVTFPLQLIVLKYLKNESMVMNAWIWTSVIISRGQLFVSYTITLAENSPSALIPHPFHLV